MKLKALALSIAMIAGVCAANAQTAKTGKDVFVGVGAGVNTVFTPKASAPSFYGNIMVGKWISPVFGVRAVIGGPFQTINSDVIASNFPASFTKNKLFGELNVDGIINFCNIGRDDLANFDVYMFLGPTLNVATKGSKFVTTADDQPAAALLVKEDKNTVARVGATVGLGLGYNITKSFELALEGRFGVAPSIFGDADQYRKAEGTGRLTLNGIWTIGGKHSKADRLAAAAAVAGYLTAAESAAAITKALEENPKIVEKVVTKEVVKEVVKDAPVAAVASATAAFFALNSATLTPADKARIKLFADSIKAGSKDQVYVVSGYADKATGSASANQKISEKRAKAVYDALVAEGVDAKQLETKAEGGVGPMFFNNISLSRTAIVAPKN
ncbi:MAG: OmpA family protein [Bacteroidales bacterium]|nr:OmpA family protein [Bacteroidales bacterium]